MVLKPIGEVKAFGEGESAKPFRISKHRGLYFYVTAKQAERMMELNEQYKDFKSRGRKSGPEPIEEIKIIGRGGKPGLKPFLLEDRKERCVCIPADQVNRFREINEECRDIRKRQKAAKKAAE